MVVWPIQNCKKSWSLGKYCFKSTSTGIDGMMTLCNKKKKSCLNEFFSARSFVAIQKNSHLVGRAEKIAFPSLNQDQKVEFWPFWPAVYNTVVTLELPHQCIWLHWSILTPVMRVVRHGSPYGSWRDDTRSPVVIMANTFVRSCHCILSTQKKNFRVF